jgi:hypothetical protein
MTETLFGLRIPFVILFAAVAAILSWLAIRSSAE